VHNKQIYSPQLIGRTAVIQAYEPISGDCISAGGVYFPAPRSWRKFAVAGNGEVTCQSNRSHRAGICTSVDLLSVDKINRTPGGPGNPWPPPHAVAPHNKPSQKNHYRTTDTVPYRTRV